MLSTNCRFGEIRTFSALGRGIQNSRKACKLVGLLCGQILEECIIIRLLCDYIEYCIIRLLCYYIEYCMYPTSLLLNKKSQPLYSDRILYHITYLQRQAVTAHHPKCLHQAGVEEHHLEHHGPGGRHNHKCWSNSNTNRR